MNYEVEEIKNLILGYLKQEFFGSSGFKTYPGEKISLNSEAILKNKIIYGEDLIYALKEMHFDEITKVVLEDERQIQDMSSKLEELVKGKDGPFVDKIKEIIKEYKPKQNL